VEDSVAAAFGCCGGAVGGYDFGGRFDWGERGYGEMAAHANGGYRLTFTITTTASLLGGLWTSRGFSALSAGLLCCSMLLVFFLRLTSLRLKMTTRLSRIPVKRLVNSIQLDETTNHQITK
jgi:hypothetical protein